MWTVGAAGPEHTAHETEGVGDALLFESFAKRCRGVASAEHVALHVWVRHTLVAAGGVGLQGNDFEAFGTPALPITVPEELERKRAQFHIIKCDGLGVHADGPLPAMNCDGAKLRFQLPQIGSDSGDGEPFRRRALQMVFESFQLPPQVPGTSNHFRLKHWHDERQAMPAGLEQTLSGLLQGRVTGSNKPKERVFRT